MARLATNKALISGVFSTMVDGGFKKEWEVAGSEGVWWESMETGGAESNTRHGRTI